MAATSARKVAFPHQSVEEICTEKMMHEGTYLLVYELIAGAVSCKVRLSQDGHLALTQRGASSVFAEKTDTSTQLKVGQRGEKITAPLPRGAYSIKWKGL